MSMMTTAARWISGRTKLANDLPAAEDRLAEIEADPPKSADPAEHLEWVERRDAGRREVEALRSALAIATAEAAKAEAAQRDADDDAKHAAEERQARVDEKLTRAACTAIGRAIATIEALDASNARTAEVNAQRGQRPFIVDAETRVRQIPARTIPDVFEDRVVWQPADHSPPEFGRRNGSARSRLHEKDRVRLCATGARNSRADA